MLGCCILPCSNTDARWPGSTQLALPQTVSGVGQAHAGKTNPLNGEDSALAAGQSVLAPGNADGELGLEACEQGTTKIMTTESGRALPSRRASSLQPGHAPWHRNQPSPPRRCHWLYLGQFISLVLSYQEKSYTLTRRVHGFGQAIEEGIVGNVLQALGRAVQRRGRKGEKSNLSD